MVLPVCPLRSLAEGDRGEQVTRDPVEPIGEPGDHGVGRVPHGHGDEHRVAGDPLGQAQKRGPVMGRR